MKEMEEMELRGFKLTVNFRKKQPPVRGKVSVVGGQRTLTDTVFAVMQHLLCGFVRDSVYSFTFRSRLNRFCALSNKSNRQEDTECNLLRELVRFPVS